MPLTFNGCVTAQGLTVRTKKVICLVCYTNFALYKGGYSKGIACLDKRDRSKESGRVLVGRFDVVN